MNQFENTVVSSRESILKTNKVLRNTYLLLSLSFVFSAIMAMVAVAMGVSQGAGGIASIAAIIVVWFVIPRFAESEGIGGLVCVFLFTGLLGFGLGPYLNAMVTVFSNGKALVVTALGGTGIIFLALSAYAITTKKDFNFLGGFLFAGVIVLFVAILANMFFKMPAFALAISAGFMIISSGLILFQTSRIINGGEDNYILATVGIFVSLYNIFASLLHILSAFAGER